MLLVVVVLVEASVTVPGRWLLLLLLLMWRVIVLVLMRVMVVLMILRIAIGHRISGSTVSNRGCRAIYHMIYPRIAGGAIIQLASIGPTSATCRNHHLLVIAGEVPLQVMLLLLLLRRLLWVQLIEIAIVKMGIATEERRSLGGRGRRRLRRRSTTPRHSHAHIVQKVQTVLRRCGGCGWNRLLLLLLLLRLLLMVVSDGGMWMMRDVVMGLLGRRRRCRHRVPQLALQHRKLIQRVHIREQHLAGVGRPAVMLRATTTSGRGHQRNRR